jgi:hypothetical protein
MVSISHLVQLPRSEFGTPQIIERNLQPFPLHEYNARHLEMGLDQKLSQGKIFLLKSDE